MGKNKLLAKNLIKLEPKLSFKIENRLLKILYCNTSAITIKLYLIDLEILFSRNPFFQQNNADFSFVQQNYLKTLTVESHTNDEEIIFPIPDEFASKNLFIEVSSQSNKCFEAYFSHNLNVTVSENIGEVKVLDEKLKPLSKVYIKAFARMTDGTVRFYKDGYTDLRGRFNFISLNTDQLKLLKRFSIFFYHPELGSLTKECDPPSNILKDGNVQTISDFDSYQKQKTEYKKEWRKQNFEEKVCKKK